MAITGKKLVLYIIILFAYFMLSTVSYAQECTSCHEIKHGLTGNACDNCHYNTTFIDGKHIEKPFSPGFMHDSFDWEGDNANEKGPDRLNESCPACHANMIEHTAQELNVCEDCHVKSQIKKSKLIFVREDIEDYIPLVYSHYNGSYIDVPDQSVSGRTKSSCFGFNTETGEGSCHGVNYVKKDKTGGYFALNQDNYTGIFSRGDPYHWNAPSDYLPDSKDCLFCHAQKDISVRKAWGNPGNLPSDSSHSDAKNDDCLDCHVQGEFRSFHGKEIVWQAEKSNVTTILMVSLLVLVVIVIILWRKQR
ncbi:MAG: hypothetical protein OIN89_07310 [Candidatus Methanoperedens sp.]|jgi:hypothetical protein|nr:hypothetical protein [Candidatus Methanoperedens sp.]PKL53589.1 MAG: hypothetical protein CVV36_06350 [Candidatus Methanoperedenaceae archaeon HGW-Methanoperedenaceae-1]